MTQVVALIVALLKAIPYFDRWFDKPEIERENTERQDVDIEHEENVKRKRPSDDFWRGRSP